MPKPVNRLVTGPRLDDLEAFVNQGLGHDGTEIVVVFYEQEAFSVQSILLPSPAPMRKIKKSRDYFWPFGDSCNPATAVNKP